MLRPWRDEDVAPFAEMNGDPRVMEHFPAPLSPAQSDALLQRIRAQFTEHGFGLWALEVAGGPPFIGFAGLSRPSFDAPFTPCVEIGWRLSYPHWGRGYATEAAQAALGFGFEEIGLPEIVSFTARQNVRSVRVMQKLGMHHDPGDDFDHPLLPEGHPLRRHVLYRIDRGAWAARAQKRVLP